MNIILRIIYAEQKMNNRLESILELTAIEDVRREHSSTVPYSPLNQVESNR